MAVSRSWPRRSALSDVYGAVRCGPCADGQPCAYEGGRRADEQRDRELTAMRTTCRSKAPRISAPRRRADVGSPTTRPGWRPGCAPHQPRTGAEGDGRAGRLPRPRWRVRRRSAVPDHADGEASSERGRAGPQRAPSPAPTRTTTPTGAAPGRRRSQPAPPSPRPHPGPDPEVEEQAPPRSTRSTRGRSAATRCSTVGPAGSRRA